MTEPASPAWAERAAERSPIVQRSRSRGMQQATVIVQAAQRLIAVKGSAFTTQELAKEAGVALQTFYRYFESKDHLLLAVIENMVAQACVDAAEQASEFADPIARLHFYLTSVFETGDVEAYGAAGPRFVTTEHWRLHRVHPVELAQATRPFTDLLLTEIRAASEAGLLAPRDPEYDAWLITQLVMAVFHHYAFMTTDEYAGLKAERLWAFCLAALGGQEPAAEQRARAPKRRAK